MNFIEIAYHIHQEREIIRKIVLVITKILSWISDGVGGLAKGDIASGIVKDVWQDIFGTK